MFGHATASRLHGIPVYVYTDAKGRTLDDLRTIIEKIELKAHVRSDDPDVLALKDIIERKIERLEHEVEESSVNDPERVRKIREAGRQAGAR